MAMHCVLPCNIVHQYRGYEQLHVRAQPMGSHCIQAAVPGVHQVIQLGGLNLHVRFVHDHEGLHHAQG